MKWAYGLFASPESAQRAFEKLRDAGVPPREIQIMSSEPIEGFEFGRQDSSTVMQWIAISGAATGLIGAYLLTWLTQEDWAINTGGMPIVTNWTNMIIIFEMTMLSAVFATVFTLLRTARLPGRMSALYDPEISHGKILVGLSNPSTGALEAIRSVLEPGDTVKTAEG